MYLFKQIFQYLDEYYFSASLGSYENFDLESTVALVVIIGGLCLGMMIASIALFIQKRHVGKMIKLLLDNGCHDKESAKSLYELGLSKNAFIKMQLNGRTDLRKILSIVENDKVFTYLDEVSHTFSDEKREKDAPRKREYRLHKISPLYAKFFISEEMKQKAITRYGRKGSPWWTLPLSILAIILVFFASLRLTPFLVNMLDVTISNLKF